MGQVEELLIVWIQRVVDLNDGARKLEKLLLAVLLNAFWLAQTVPEGYNKNDSKCRNLLLCLLMTASDLSDQTKSWDNTKHIAVSTSSLAFTQIKLKICHSHFWIQPGNEYVHSRSAQPSNPTIQSREAGDFWCLPPVWNFRATCLIPLFYISSLVLLSNPFALSVLFFSTFGPFSWPLFPWTSIFWKVGSFVWLLFVVFFISS